MASIRSSSALPPTRGSRCGRCRRSPRAASCHDCRWRCRFPVPRARRAAWCLTKLIPGSAARSRRLWVASCVHSASGGQVLCVTHLPQVASQGHHHLRVAKSTDGRTTRTALTELAPQERVEEIARMLGGVEVTGKAREHAREMLRTHLDLPPDPSPTDRMPALKAKDLLAQAKVAAPRSAGRILGWLSRRSGWGCSGSKAGATAGARAEARGRRRRRPRTAAAPGRRGRRLPRATLHGGCQVVCRRRWDARVARWTAQGWRCGRERPRP